MTDVYVPTLATTFNVEVLNLALLESVQKLGYNKAS